MEEIGEASTASRITKTRSMIDEEADPQTLRNEIADLEKRLRDAKAALKQKTVTPSESKDEDLTDTKTVHDASDDKEGGSPAMGTAVRKHTSLLRSPRGETEETTPPTTLDPTQHAMLLLSDSALPLGSFAFSSGLESYLAHRRAVGGSSRSSSSEVVERFVELSLSSVAASALPYVLAGFRDPGQLRALDEAFDASTACSVARRASATMGRGLLTVWERAFRGAEEEEEEEEKEGGARAALDAFRAAMRAPPPTDGGPVLPSAHLPALWGCVARAMGLALAQAAYVFLFGHARALLSAGVRANVVGPYQAHAVLAAAWLRGSVRSAVENAWDVAVEDAGQSVPVLDLYQGRHELLYSRIFNS
ncbi:hypothetical protein GP486_001955 [Trichoglossum hirsutum]|uniref:Urease accessory protein UreF n=1 Tax=Trichoglossum hirsutum TaxID=265104 RepID=A0A9P8LFX0_9PEZI|nr:hypothetical protein GP486_001955 [Trichoglossum hirsutum]